MKKLFFCVLLISLAVFCSTGCGKKEAAKKTAEEAIPVKVMKVKLQTLDKVLEYVGNVKGQDEAVIYPKVSGKIIEKIKEDGAPVKKGEVIVNIDRDEVGLKFEKAPVESPLNGFVGRVYVDIGSYVSTQTPVALITDIDKAEINLDIPEKYLPRVSLNQLAEISVDTYPGRSFTGKVSMISPVVDLATRTAPIKIVIENKDHSLQSGMFATVRLVIAESKNIPVILKESIMGREPETFVYVVENNIAILRKVSLGLNQGSFYEVSSGLKEGELVVTMGLQRLRDGSKVLAEE